MALVPAVVDAVGRVPVVAAGGIADARGIAAAMALGASGVWMGTRFVATAESAAHPAYQRALLEAAETDAVYTRVFDGGWPGAPHRVLRNSTIARSESAESGAPGRRPGEGEAIGRHPDGAPVIRYAADEPLTGMTGEIEAMALYAGQSAALVREVPSAADLVPGLLSRSREVLTDALARLQGGSRLGRARDSHRTGSRELPVAGRDGRRGPGRAPAAQPSRRCGQAPALAPAPAPAPENTSIDG